MWWKNQLKFHQYTNFSPYQIVIIRPYRPNCVFIHLFLSFNIRSFSVCSYIHLFSWQISKMLPWKFMKKSSRLWLSSIVITPLPNSPPVFVTAPSFNCRVRECPPLLSTLRNEPLATDFSKAREQSLPHRFSASPHQFWGQSSAQ